MPLLHLHSGSQATSRRLWDAEEQTADKITFVIKDAEGQQGYPGNAVMKVTYEVTEANELSITYHAIRLQFLPTTAPKLAICC